MYKIDSIDEEEDETLIELAKILSNFTEFIGGKQHIMKLFKVLEKLLILDELLVRHEVIFKKCIQFFIGNDYF